MKIVNGQIITDDHPSSSNLPTVNAAAVVDAGNEGTQGSFFSQSIRLCGSPVSYGYLTCAMAVSFLFNGVAGGFFVGLAVGGAYLYGQRDSADSSSSGGAFGMNRMATRSSSSRGGGANIKGISDLPKPPPSA